MLVVLGVAAVAAGAVFAAVVAPGSLGPSPSATGSTRASGASGSPASSVGPGASGAASSAATSPSGGGSATPGPSGGSGGTASPGSSAGAGASASPGASAVPPGVASLRRSLLATSDPFANCTQKGPGRVFPGSAVEPRLAVNPKNAADVVVTWQQDRWAGGGARGILSAWTTDGGLHWHPVIQPFSKCAAAGSPYQRASDPWVVYGADGTVIESALGIFADGSTDVLVTRSTDGGKTWSPPAIVSKGLPHGFNDKESVTLDASRPGVVHVVWDRSIVADADAGEQISATLIPGRTYYASSADGGVTWTKPRAIASTAGTPIGNQIASLPNGTIVDVFDQLAGRASLEQSIRSTDGGKTWSKPLTVATRRRPTAPLPGTTSALRTGDGIPDVAVRTSDGAVVLVWEDGRFRKGTGIDIAVSISTDGGATWSAPVKENPTGGSDWAFTPDVTIAADGSIAVAYNALHTAKAAGTLPTDRFLARSTDGKAWRATSLTAKPFDLRRAPNALGYFLGDYAGLAPTSGGIAAAYGVNVASSPVGTSSLEVTITAP
jgi:Neuraminidase (sialidase)